MSQGKNDRGVTKHRKKRIWDMHYKDGLSEFQIAARLKHSISTVDRVLSGRIFFEPRRCDLCKRLSNRFSWTGDEGLEWVLRSRIDVWRGDKGALPRE